MTATFYMVRQLYTESAIIVFLPVKKELFSRDISIRDLLWVEYKREGLKEVQHEWWGSDKAYHTLHSSVDLGRHSIIRIWQSSKCFYMYKSCTCTHWKETQCSLAHNQLFQAYLRRKKVKCRVNYILMCTNWIWSRSLGEPNANPTTCRSKHVKGDVASSHRPGYCPGSSLKSVVATTQHWQWER